MDKQAQTEPSAGTPIIQRIINHLEPGRSRRASTDPAYERPMIDESVITLKMRENFEEAGDLEMVSIVPSRPDRISGR